MVADIEEVRKLGRVRHFSSKAECKRSHTGVKTYFPDRRLYCKIVRKRPRIPRSTLKAVTTCRK